jgi:hypothetical protein
MVLFRWFSLTLIVLALMLLGADIISTLEAGTGVVVRPMDKVLLLFGLDAKPWIQASFSPNVSNALVAVLSLPGWATLGVVGVMLTLLIPPRRERPPEPAHAEAEHEHEH